MSPKWWSERPQLLPLDKDQQLASCKQEHLWKSSRFHSNIFSNTAEQQQQQNPDNNPHKKGKQNSFSLAASFHPPVPGGNFPAAKGEQGEWPVSPALFLPTRDRQSWAMERWLGTRKKKIRGYQYQPHSGRSCASQGGAALPRDLLCRGPQQLLPLEGTHGQDSCNWA